MTRMLISALALSVISASPLSAQPVSKMSTAELISWASAQKACGDMPVTGAVYVALGNKVEVTCGEATGFVPLAAAAFAGPAAWGFSAFAGLALAALAGGANSSANNTQ